MEADKTSAAGRLKVFVSYSRDDREFAEQLVAFLDDHGFDVSIDQDEPGAEDMVRARLQQVIASCDTVVLVLSPSSAESRVCQLEADIARKAGKRILCVLSRSMDDIEPPVGTADRQWIYFYSDPERSGSGFYNGQRVLERALKMNIGWHRRHTELFQLAERWRFGDGEDPLLWGDALKAAQAWREAVPAGDQISGLVSEFLEASRRAEAHRSEDRHPDDRRADQDRAYLDRVAELERGKVAAAQHARADEERRRAEEDRRQQEERRKTDTWEYRGPPAAEPHEPVRKARTPTPPPSSAPAANPIFDDLFEPASKAFDRFDDASSAPSGDIFDDPAFSIRPRNTQNGRSSSGKSSGARASAKSRAPAKRSSGGGSVAILAVLLILLIGGGAAFMMYLPTMPNPFAVPATEEESAPQTAAAAAPAAQPERGPAVAPEAPATSELAAAPPAPGALEGAPQAATATTAPAETATEAAPAATADSDEQQWQDARKAGTLMAYRDYMLRPAKGRYYDTAMRESRRRIDQLSVHPESLIVILPGPVVFRELPTQDVDGRVLGLPEQDLPILDRITSVREGEWYVFDRGGPWPFRFVAASDITARRPTPAQPTPASPPSSSPELPPAASAPASSAPAAAPASAAPAAAPPLPEPVPTLAAPPTQPSLPPAQ